MENEMGFYVYFPDDRPQKKIKRKVMIEAVKVAESIGEKK